MSSELSTVVSSGQAQISFVIGRNFTDKLPTPNTLDAETFVEKLLKRQRRVGPKDGLYIAPCKLTPGTRLEDKNVLAVTALAVDLDGKKDSVDLDKFLADMPYRAVLYTTHSSTPETLRCRVIFPLAAPVTPAEYAVLWKWAYEHTGRVMDPACKNPSRLHYLPSCAPDADQSHHWIREAHGPLLSMSAVPADQRTPAAAQERPAKPAGATFEPLTDEEAAKALTTLLGLPLFVWAAENPSEVSYPVWRGLATNLAALAKDSPAIYADCEEAFHELSRADPSRYSASHCTTTFQGAVVSVNNTGPVRWDTLAEAGAPSDLCTGNPGAAPAATARILSRPPKAAVVSVPAGKFIMCKSANTYLVRNDVTGRYDEELIDAVASVVMRSVGVAAKDLGDFKAALPQFSEKRPFYDTTDALVTYEGKTYLNTYEPTRLTPRPGNCQPILDLVLHLTDNDPDARDYVLGWLAAPLQSLHFSGRPMKMETALVFQGEQGSGKGTLSKVIELIYGSSNFLEMGQDALDSRFNDELAGRLFVICNEVMSGTNRSGETANKLKPWVTDAEIKVERKFEERRKVANNFNIIFTSNDEKPVIIEQSDRRYSVFHGRRINPEMTAPIWEDIHGDKAMVAAFFDYLLNYQNLTRRAQLFETEIRAEIMKLSLPSYAKFYAEHQEVGWYASSHDWAQNSRNADQPRCLDDGSVPCAVYLAVYADYCRKNNLLAHSAQAVGRHLAGEHNIQLVRRNFNGTTLRAYAGIPLYPAAGTLLEGDELYIPNTTTKALQAPAMVTSTQSVKSFVDDTRELGWHSASSDWTVSAPPGALRVAVEADNAVPATAVHEVYIDYCRRRGLPAASGHVLGRAVGAAFGASVTRRYNGVMKRVYTNIPLDPTL